MYNVLVSDIYTAVNITIPEEKFSKLCNCLGYTTDRKYIELDYNEYSEYDISIPAIIGDKLYEFYYNSFEDDILDYVKIYKGDI